MAIVFTVNNDALLENSGQNFEYSITNTYATVVAYRLDVRNGTAISSQDYYGSASSSGFSVQPGQTVTIGINQIVDDPMFEADEDFSVNITYVNPDTGISQTDTYILTILNDDPASTLSINNASANEGDIGSTFIDFTVTRGGNTNGTASVGYLVAGSGANPANPTDFNTSTYPLSGTVNFAAGASSATIRVAVAGDYVIEQNETFAITLANPVNAIISQGTGTGTIVNDDASYTIVQSGFTEGDAGSANMRFTVTPDRVLPVAQTVYFTFGGGTATAGTDYDGTPQTLTFAANSGASLTLTVPVFGDLAVEGNETFNVNAYRDSGYTVLAATPTSATITDDDAAGTLSIGDVSIVEGDANTRNAVLTVTRTGGSGDVSVIYSTADGGGTLAAATAGSDYNVVSGTLNFRNGSQSETIMVPIRGDTTLEANENFSVNLSNAGIIAAKQATISKGTGIVTIVNDEGGPGTTPGTGSNGSSVTTSSSFVASPDAQITSIQTTNAAGTDPINLTGNSRDQLITGNNGDNIINGGGGNDTLVGGGGNDTYLVRGPGDVVIEGNGGGRDTVFTTVSYNLGVNEIEVLSTVNNSATDNINLIGNFASQTIIGNYGNNILNGGSGGLDTLIGLRGDDLYAVGDSRTVIVENAGEGADTVVTSVNYTLAAGVSVEVLAAQNLGGIEALTLRGNELGQIVVGNEGANIIDGGAGADVLVGGGGADRFAFTTALGNGNVDAIVDFAAGTDRIQLSSAIFGAVGTSVTAAGFVNGNAATTADQHIVYNATTGQIFYDADGSGAGAAILFATVAAGTQLSAASFEVAAPTVIG